jgi:hypothetical protein
MPDQKTDDENSQASDPNMSGSAQTQAVNRLEVAKMTPSCEYGEHYEAPAGSISRK